jgi:subtilisin family serine protease
MVRKGDIVLAENAVEGVLFKTSSVWYKDAFNRYYWSGAMAKDFEIPQDASNISIPATLSFTDDGPNDAWLNRLGIAEIWKVSRGDGANIAVLDTGLNLNNPALVNRLFTPADLNTISTRSFLKEEADIMDLFGHGTHCASLIGFDNSTITIGIAPESRLFAGKISDFGVLSSYDVLSDAIKWAANIRQVDIISVSFGVNGKDGSVQGIKDAVALALSKNKIIVAAIGDAENDNNPAFPAILDGCISVGASDGSGQYWDGNVDYDKTTIYAPGVEIVSNVAKSPYFDNGDVKPYPMTGSSQAAAITSGVVALIVSWLRKNKKPVVNTEIKKIISTNAGVLASGSRPALDPLTIFSALQKKL